MSDVMLFGVLRMPYEMAMSDEMSRWQFWQRAQEAADRLEKAEQPAAPAPKDAMEIMELAKALCYADTKCVLQAETEDWDLRYREKETAEAALKSAVTALVQERDDLKTRIEFVRTMFMEQVARVKELEAQLAAQPVPLKKHEIHMALDRSGVQSTGLSLNEEVKIARAIEAAHGINAAAQGAQEGKT